MVASNIIAGKEGSGIAKKINIFCLLAAIAIVLILPFKKEIWYDETVSVLCSKGISHDSRFLFPDTHTLTSTQVDGLNTAQNVFNATVIDNGNSFLYNIGLHWFTDLFGNNLVVCMMFSKLCAIAALIAFFALCKLLLKNSLFTSFAVMLLATDGDFINMSHEIRAYSMGGFFVTLAAVYLCKFMYQSEKTLYLFFTGLFSVAAILSHFLSVYIIIVFLFVLVFIKRTSLFSVKNMLAILLPVSLLAVYFYFSMTGIQQINIQNHTIQENTASGFSLWTVLISSIRFTAFNFKAVFPAFYDKTFVSVISFLLILVLYIAGIKAATNKTGKRCLHLLFLLGISSTLFLALLSIKSHHYTSLYFRYYSFGIPFSCLFIAYALYIISWDSKINKYVKGAVIAIIIIPCCLLFVSVIKNTRALLKYNHVAIAEQITHDNIVKLGVPEWRDAFLVNSFLPAGYKIDYFRNPGSQDFILYRASGEDQVPVIKEDH